MKHLAISLFISVVSLSTFAQNRSIEFIDNSLSTALEEAKKSNKLIFIDAYTTWCGPCKWMAANKFTNDTIADYFNENFVNLKLNMEKGDGKSFAKDYSVKVFPTLLFIDASGNVVHKKVGASRNTEDYIKMGQDAKNPKNSLTGMTARYTGGEQTPEFLADYLNALRAAGEPSQEVLTTYYASIDEHDFLNESTFEIVKNHDRSIDSKAIKFVLGNKDKFYALYGEDAERLLYQNHLSWVMEDVTGKQADRKEMEKRMIEVKKRNIPDWQKIILIADLTELKKEKRMDEYCEIAAADVGEYFKEDPYMLNNFAWTMFENTDNVEYLNEAVKWTDIAIERQPTPFVLDTKANLLFKLNKKEEAIETQNKAIEIAEINGFNESTIKDLKATLKKFKK